VNGWTPTETYTPGRIDIYEGVDCSGECDQFTSRFLQAKFPEADFTAGWYEHVLGDMIFMAPDQVIWHNYDDTLLPGDMIVLYKDDGFHSGIVHSVAGGIDYAYSNTDGDHLGYFGNVAAQGWTIMGFFRYQPGVLFEDPTDWTGMSCVQLHATGASADLEVRCVLQYKTALNFNAPWYTSGSHNFGYEGEAAATLSTQKTATLVGTLNHTTGLCVFDLAPDSGEEPLDLFLVESVEFFFDVAAHEELTFVGWDTIPYPNETYVPGTGIAMDRIALKHSTDYFGARLAVDSMPNYKPRYGYTMDTERAEVGFKNVQDLQHDPDYEGEASDLRSLKGLSAMASEMILAQTLYTPTWNLANVERDLVDVDDQWLALPLWGDMDEDGYCLHVGKVIGDTFPVAIHYADFILQGGTRGIAKTAGVRQAGTEFMLYSSEDLGVTKTAIRTVTADAVGGYRVGTGQEKAPLVYYIGAFFLGGFVNVEEVWKGVSTTSVGHLHLSYHPVSNEMLVTECGFISGVGQLRIRPGTTWSSRVAVPTSASYDTACTPTNIFGGHILVEDIGPIAFARKQTDLMGAWGSRRELATGMDLNWAIAMEYNGFLALAGNDGTDVVQFMRFSLDDPYPRFDAAAAVAVVPCDGLSAPALASFEDLWTLIAASSNLDDVSVLSSIDTGRTWDPRLTVADAGTHPALCSLRTDLWLATYRAESYQGAVGRCEVRRINGEAWTVGPVLGPFPCDARRPAIIANQKTYDLTLLTPKGTEWGIAGATPGIVEYVSKDGGDTWADPVVHEVV
jgi:hypothetical protein